MKKAIIFFCMLLVFLCSCSKPETLVIKPEDKTAVFFILAPDSGTIYESINYWSKLEKTAGEVHIFTDPAAKDSVESLLGAKHFVDADKLAQKIVDTFQSIQAQRSIIFIATHGSENGFCYPNSSTCNLTEDFLIDALSPIIKNSKLKQLLIIPASCYQKPVMDRFAIKAENYQWPFQIAFTEQKFVEYCSAGGFPDMLLNNSFSPVKYLITYNQIDRFLEIYNLEDLLTFYNDLFQSKSEKTKRARLFELRKLSPGNIKLDDFGFNIRIEKLIFYDLKNPQIFPFNKTVQDVLENFPLEKHLYKNIANMTFSIPSEKEKGTSIRVSIPVKGDPSTILNEKKLENKQYTELTVTLSRKPGY